MSLSAVITRPVLHAKSGSASHATVVFDATRVFEEHIV